MFILSFCSQTGTDAGRLCHMKTLQSLREQIHSYVAVCQTVDVYLDSQMPAVCFCDSNVFVSKAKERVKMFAHTVV